MAESLRSLGGAGPEPRRSRRAVGFLRVSKQPETAVAVLHNDVVPFYSKLDLPIGALLTDNGRAICGTERHPYEPYLALNDIANRKTEVGSPRTNGFVESFNGTVPEEFFRPTMRSRLYESVEALQIELEPACTTTTTSARTSATATRAAARGNRRVPRHPVIRKRGRLRRHMKVRRADGGFAAAPQGRRRFYSPPNVSFRERAGVCFRIAQRPVSG
jgi:transposase InsO family protein